MASGGREVARAYVTIVPKTDGTSNKVIQSIFKGAGKAGTEGGEKAGKGFLGSITGAAGKAGKLLAAGVAVGAGAATLALGAFAKSAVQAGSQFDASMSQVAATMGKSVEQMESEIVTVGDFTGNLRDFAKEMGATTAFSASQAADALNYMALAGYDATTSVEMLPNVLNLAAAGGIELAEASDMVTDAQSALGLTIEETATMVDQMAAAASASNTSVAQLGQALLTVGGTAKDLSGGTLEAATALGILANNGIKGSEGGTALRNIMLSLIPKSEDAAAAMERLGFNAYDADGNLRPLNESFSDLAVGLSALSTKDRQEALSAMFNKVDLKSVNALLANTVEGVDSVEYSVMGLLSDFDGDEFEAFWVELADEVDTTGHVTEDVFQAIYDSLDEAGNVTDETRQSLLDMGLSADKVDFIMDGLADTVMGQKSGWDNLEAAIAGAWYTTDSIAESFTNMGLDIDSVKAGLEGVGVTADEFTEALQYSNGSAEEFANLLLQSADEGTSLDDVVGYLGGDLDKLQESFNDTTGAAEAMANTQLDNLQGDMTMFQSALEGVYIAFSESLTPALRDFVQFGTEGLGKVNELLNSEGFQDAAGKAAEHITTALSNAVQAVGEFASGFAGAFDGEGLARLFDRIGGAIEGMSGNLGGAAGVGAAFADALDYVVGVLNGVLDAFDDFSFTLAMTGDAGQATTDAVNKVGKAFGIAGGLVSPFAEIVGGAMGLVQMAVEKVVGFVQSNLPMLQEIGGKLTEIGGIVGDVLGGAIDFVTGLLDVWWTILSDLASSALPAVSGALDLVIGVLTWLAEMLEGLWGTLEIGISWMAMIYNEVAPYIEEAFAAVGDALTSVGEYFASIASDAQADWQALQDWLRGVPGRILGFFQGLPGSMNDKFKQVKEKAKARMDEMTSAIESIPGKIVGFFSSIGTDVAAKFTDMKDSALKVVDDLKDKVSEKVEAIIGFFTGIGSTSITMPHVPVPKFSISPSGWVIGDLLKGTIPTLSVSWAARGGLVDGATLIGAGEAGREAIVPLENAEAMQPFADAVAEGLEDMPGDAEYVVRWLSRNLGPIIKDYTPTVSRRDFNRAVGHA